jgi:hypothetical protein
MKPTKAKLESSVWVNTADLRWFLLSKHTVDIFPATIKEIPCRSISPCNLHMILVGITLFSILGSDTYIVVHLQVFPIHIVEFPYELL